MNANDDETDEAITDMANAMSQQSQTIPQLIAQIQQMQSTMTALQQQMNNTNTNQNTNDRNNQSSDNTSNRRRRNISKYCWSHGACSHTSFECTKRRDGHKEDATSENKKGGSTYYCIPSSCQSATDVQWNKSFKINKLFNFNTTSYTPLVPPLSQHNNISNNFVIVKGDSGATRHYFTEEDATHLLQNTSKA